MIIGIGTDLVNIERIEKILIRHGSRFENKYFTNHEQDKAQNRNKSGKKAEFYAKRFAAKEACVKALGSGFIDDIYMKDIDVKSNEFGRPSITLSGGAMDRLKVLTPENMQISIHLSLSDDYPYAQAFVIIEAYAIQH